MVSPLLGKLLAANRTELNLRFERARLAEPSIEPKAFERAVAEWVDPVVIAVASVAPQDVEEVLRVTYTAALDVVSRGLASQCPAVSRVFTEVAPRAARWVASDPERLLRALIRATQSVGAFPGAGPEKWILEMSRLSAQIDDAEHWLEAGKVVAWRCGLSTARDSALATALGLEPRIAWDALSVSEGEAAVPLVEAVSRLQADPWLAPKHAAMEKLPPRELQIVRICGGFSGFGGPFRQPPTVDHDGERLLARSGDEQFEICADLFGAAVLRVTVPPAPAGPVETRWKLTSTGAVAKGDLTRVLPELRSAGAWAANRSTLAVTFPHSHRIALVAAASSP
ncbi:MAG: hypothetical protein JNJ88_16535 [Planctomycetes bacterium]|nr:hypothetical protein [Planctomycetota bacterium]